MGFSESVSTRLQSQTTSRFAIPPASPSGFGCTYWCQFASSPLLEGLQYKSPAGASSHQHLKLYSALEARLQPDAISSCGGNTQSEKTEV